MKKNSITTAFIYLLTFYGFESFCIESSNEKLNYQEQSINKLKYNATSTVNSATNAVKEEGEYSYNTTNSTVKKSVDTVKDDIKNLQTKNAKQFENKSFSSANYYKTLNDKSEITLKGNVVSHIWYKNEEAHLQERSLEQTNANMGKEVDAVLQITAEHINGTLGITCGADLQADLALVNGYLNSDNKKATVFLNSAYSRIDLGISKWG